MLVHPYSPVASVQYQTHDYKRVDPCQLRLVNHSSRPIETQNRITVDDQFDEQPLILWPQDERGTRYSIMFRRWVI